MKKNKFFTRKVKAILAGTFLAGVIFTGNVLASTENLKLDTTVAFDTWNNLSEQEKVQTVMPKAYNVEIPENILNKYEIETVPRVLEQLLGNSVNPLNPVGSVNDSRFNLAEELNLRVENQYNTTECWAFSLIKSMETNKALKSGLRDIEDFSERHMDYATALNFTDGTNEAGFYRDVGNGGLLVVGLAYLTNGQGAVLEADMPFEDDERRISLSEINKTVDTVVTDYVVLPTIHKEYELDSNGNTQRVKYKKDDGTEYTETELKAVRNIIKEHLVENGAIASMTGGNLLGFYNNTNPFNSTTYNCNVSDKTRDHAITIVGWDDNYPKENFGEGKMPSTDGAYIVLNSYGSESFENGYMYISYEDFFIEEEIYGISSTSDVDYENIYQHDYYGGIHKIGLDTQLTGSIGTSFKRDINKNETINSIGVNLANYANIEVYINPEDASFLPSKLIKVGESKEVLSPGFHRIDITPTKLTGEEFAIIIKQTSESGGFYFKIEANIENSAYGLVDSDNRSYIALNENTWSNIANLSVDGVDMTKADVCIKAYTIEDDTNQEPDTDDSNTPTIPGDDKPDIPTTPDKEEPPVESEKIEIETIYTVQENYIMNIEFNTTKQEALNNITVNAGRNIINSDGSPVEDDEIIKTGMKLRISDGSIYTLIVRGDINQDGNVSLIDLSKLLLHYNGFKGFELSGNAEKAADMNIDGKVSLVDLSQMLVLYNSI